MYQGTFLTKNMRTLINKMRTYKEYLVSVLQFMTFFPQHWHRELSHRRICLYPSQNRTVYAITFFQYEDSKLIKYELYALQISLILISFFPTGITPQGEKNKSQYPKREKRGKSVKKHFLAFPGKSCSKNSPCRPTE